MIRALHSDSSQETNNVTMPPAVQGRTRRFLRTLRAEKAERGDPEHLLLVADGVPML